MSDEKKVTARDVAAAKGAKRLAMLTAYDFPMARILDRAGVDIILVGDSLGNVVLGYENTLPVTMDEMVHHTAAVSRGVKRALLVADMPFMSFQAGIEDGMRNAGRLVKEGGAQAVKLEGGRRSAALVTALVEAGIPVMGHVGLTPQSVNRFGGFRVQGRDAASAELILEDARALDEAGVFSMVVEGVPAELGERVTAAVSAVTIGIGAGPGCDGQVLVLHDMLGFSGDVRPSFVRVFAELGQAADAAVRDYVREVREGTFPGGKESY